MKKEFCIVYYKKGGIELKITEDNFIEELKYKNEDALYYFIENYGWIIKTVMSNSKI